MPEPTAPPRTPVNENTFPVKSQAVIEKTVGIKEAFVDTCCSVRHLWIRAVVSGICGYVL